MPFPIEVEQEADGRWLAEIPDLPGVMAYGATSAEAIARAQALGLRVLADRVEHGEAVPEGLAGLFAVSS
ncbi:MAG TPA: type II toxin-antitoxin system HicB family antitoxin [Isosphaeraceae bacterium]